MPYLLDANVFIQVKRLHYGMDFCPACWDGLVTRTAGFTQEVGLSSPQSGRMKIAQQFTAGKGS